MHNHLVKSFPIAAILEGRALSRETERKSCWTPTLRLKEAAVCRIIQGSVRKCCATSEHLKRLEVSHCIGKSNIREHKYHCIKPGRLDPSDGPDTIYRSKSFAITVACPFQAGKDTCDLEMNLVNFISNRISDLKKKGLE